MTTAAPDPTLSRVPADSTYSGNERSERPGIADPLVLGLPLVALGAVALGLQLTGYVNVSSNGSPLALVLAASGLGLFLATVAATRLSASPASSPWQAGRSLPTVVLGALALFFLSYGLLILGLLHNWFGIQPVNIQHTVASFQISWIVAFAFLALASTRLPVLFTVLFLAFEVALVLLLISTINSSIGPSKAAGWVALVIAAAAGYVFLAVASATSGGPEYPIGKPLVG